MKVICDLSSFFFCQASLFQLLKLEIHNIPIQSFSNLVFIWLVPNNCEDIKNFKHLEYWRQI